MGGRRQLCGLAMVKGFKAYLEKACTSVDYSGNIVGVERCNAALVVVYEAVNRDCITCPLASRLDQTVGGLIYENWRGNESASVNVHRWEATKSDVPCIVSTRPGRRYDSTYLPGRRHWQSLNAAGQR